MHAVLYHLIQGYGMKYWQSIIFVAHLRRPVASRVCGWGRTPKYKSCRTSCRLSNGATFMRFRWILTNLRDIYCSQ